MKTGARFWILFLSVIVLAAGCAGRWRRWPSPMVTGDSSEPELDGDTEDELDGYGDGDTQEDGDTEAGEETSDGDEDEPRICGGHGHLEDEQCTCDAGYELDPGDPLNCVGIERCGIGPLLNGNPTWTYRDVSQQTGLPTTGEYLRLSNGRSRVRLDGGPASLPRFDGKPYNANSPLSDRRWTRADVRGGPSSFPKHPTKRKTEQALLWMFLARMKRGWPSSKPVSNTVKSPQFP